MSEQEFKGLHPKSKEGESIYFYSMDYWIDIHRMRPTLPHRLIRRGQVEVE